MKDYLELRKEELKKRGNKGFTLMEMLIVVAIIAVLIAIAIPVFMGQLENSRESTDAANIRSAYAEVTAKALTSDTDVAAKVTCTQTQKDWQNKSIDNIAGVKATDIPVDKGAEVEVKYDAASNEVTIAGKPATTSFTS